MASLPKKRKIIKRIYEKGRETILSTVNKKTPVLKQTLSIKDKNLKKTKIKEPLKLEKKRFILSEGNHNLNKTEANRLVVRRNFIEDYDLPGNYDSTRLVLLVKDPFWLYAYWEITSQSLDSLKSTLGQEDFNQSKFILRMYDVSLKDFNGKNANQSFDIEVGPDASSWYINLYNDGASYLAEIGLRTPDNRFFSLSRSNCVHTPRIRYSCRNEEIWMNVADNQDVSIYAVARRKGKFKSKSVSTHKDKFFYLTDSDIRAYYSRINPALRDIISKKLSKQFGRKTSHYAFVLKGDSKFERQELLAHLPKNFFIKEIVTGASEKIVILGQRDERQAVSGGGSEQFL